MTIRKLDEFWGWLPIMQKRSKESSEIGPDLLTIKKQLQEMKVANFLKFENSHPGRIIVRCCLAEISFSSLKF